MKNPIKIFKAAGFNLLSLSLTPVALVLFICMLCFTIKAKADDSWKNFYAVCWVDNPTNHIKYAKQMGYDYIGINNLATVATYNAIANRTGLGFYLVDPQYNKVYTFEGYDPLMNLTPGFSYTAAQKNFYETNMCWKSNEAFPLNMATGWFDSANRPHFMWDFQQQSVINRVVANIIAAGDGFDSNDNTPAVAFTFAGVAFDVPRLYGDFHIWAGGLNSFQNMSNWTGTQSSLLHGTVTHQYPTYQDGLAAFFKTLKGSMTAEFADSKWIIEPAKLYFTDWIHGDGWIEEVMSRSDKNQLQPDLLMQERGGTEFIDDTRNFSSGVGTITASIVGSSQPLNWSTDDLNRTIAGKSGLNGCWYNWFGRLGTMSITSPSMVSASLKLIRCLPNWDNLNNIPLASRSWNGSVYQSTKSYASSDVVYSRNWKNGKLFGVFLTANGIINLNAGETVSSVFNVDGYFVETTSAASEVTINGTVITLATSTVNRGYIFTLSGGGTSTAAPSVTTGTAIVTGTSTATLEGVVTPNNLATTVSFKYGTQSGIYPLTIGSQTVNAGSGTTNVSVTITGLIKNTTYYAVCRANNSAGSVSGSETSFLTTGLTVYNAEQTGTNTITVDGLLTEWGTLDISIGLTVSGLPLSNGTAAAKWTPDGLYVAVSVSDNNPTTNTGTTTPYNDDSIELYIDWDNNKQTTYDSYDRDFVTAYNSTYIYNIGSKEGVVVAGSHTATSWTKEILVPVSNFPGGATNMAGKRIGFGINLNDDNNGGSREGQKSWHTTIDTSWYDPSQFWELLMVGTETEGGGSDPAMPSDAGSSTLTLFPDMKFYARLDEGTGTVSIVDATGNCPDGSITSATWTTGSGSSGLQFNGTTNVVEIGTPTAASFGGANQKFSLSVDIKMGTTTGNNYALTKNSITGNARQWYLGAAVSGSMVGKTSHSSDGSSGNTYTSFGTSTLGITNWHNIILVYDDINRYIYVDGILENQYAVTTGLHNGTASIRLGMDANGNNAFKGILDNPRIFNDALSYAEITDLRTWPTVTNGSATSIYGLWATVTGTVAANGTTTQARIQYGTSSGNYGTMTTTAEYYIGTSSTPVTFTRTLGTLTASTQYYYRTVAYNTMGNMVYGVEQTFTTTAGTPADSASPVGTVTVNSNETFTTSVSVLLNLSATDDVGVRGYLVSTGTTTPTAGDAGWVTVGTDTTYGNDIPYTLVNSDGTHTVYVWYKDGIDNISAMSQDSIVLDTNAPLIIEITSPAGNCSYDLNGTSTRALGTTSATITLQGNAYDDNGIGTVTISNSATTTTYTATGTNTWSYNARILPVLDEGLVFRADLNDATGSTQIKDSSRYASHGTNTGSVVGTTSVFGLSRYFDGVNEYINFGDPGHTDFTDADSFSFMCWVYAIASIGDSDMPLSKFTNQKAGNYTIEMGSGAWLIYLYGIDGYKTLEISSIPLNNQWIQIAAVVDTSNLKGYMNGVQVGTTSLSGFNFGNGTSTDLLKIGHNLFNFNGYIDEARIYNRALSNAEVLQLYELTTPDQVNTFSVTAQDVPGNQGTDTVSIGAFPAVQTDWATSVTYKSALLNGTCSANNNTATVWFDYGIESGAYTGSSTTVTVTGTTATAVNVTLANLLRSQTYYFRVASSNNVGTTYGTEFEFATPPGVITGGQFNRMDMSLPGSTNFNQYLKSIGIYPGLFWARNAGTQDGIDLRDDPDTVLSDYLY